MRSSRPGGVPGVDNDPPLDPPLPDVSYVVCSTPRSGSNLLCRSLSRTGLAGDPAEYFNPIRRRPLTARWGSGASALEYADALRGRRTGANGVFGVKLHWSQLTALCDELPGHLAVGGIPSRSVIDELLPGSSFVRITRLDQEAQAVSFWVALNNREWLRPAGDSPRALPPTRYSFRGIERCRQEIVDGIVGWQCFFAVNAITPIDLTYEELAADHDAVVLRTLEQILPGAAIPAVPRPELVKQSDEHSGALLARYRVERARHRRHVAHGGRLVLGASALRRALRDLG